MYQITAGEFVLVELPSPNRAVRDGPLDLRGAPHPTIVFSHGYMGLRIQSVYMCEWLASHGFVVAAPDHVGNTFTQGGDTAIASARVRPIDVSRTLDGLLERSDGWPDETLAFAADPERVGVAGHSFGGFTTWRVAGGTIDVSAGEEVCTQNPDELICDGWPPEQEFPESALDPRFIAALPQAPGGAIVFQREGLHEIDVPVMIQAGDLDGTTPYEEEARAPFDELQGEAHLLTIAGGGHFTFSDMCLLVDELGIMIGAIDDGCGEDNIPYEAAHRIINRYATAFFKVHVAGDESYDYRSVLASASPPATIESKGAD
jgi:predicted dienelactone hydrolase